LGQVMWNLLANAIKFTPAGGRVDVTLDTVENYAQIRVSDTGKGMSPELLLHIFDRFRQGDSSSSKASQGLGLGLSIVRYIIELHGGTVWAESLGEGLGTTTIVELPLEPAQSSIVNVVTRQPSSRSLPQIVSETQDVSYLDGLKILVVDDEMDILEMIEHILENVGAQVTIVSSAKAAISTLVGGDKYDALLADIGMPEEDGFTLIGQVRALAAQSERQIPAAAITAYATERDKQLTIAAGFQLHLAKPVDPAQLIQTVAMLTGRASTNNLHN
jgi:two-component system, chemotaxis family, CheB/CheR fusion protein